ncbi:MAG: hypothetical protein O7E52_04215 [Candidatus Poribacteria bacterium]|nr:hypothetical protein [Candidatus Poribacteria bacterium]
MTELSVSSIDDELLDAVELKASVDQDTLRTQARWPIAAGKGLISGHPAILTILEPYVVLQRGHFIMLLAAIRTALRRKLPLITVYPSDILPKRTSDKPHKSELSFAEITYLTIEMDDLSCARLPQITILTDPDATVGFSTRLPLGDLVFAELNRECETGPATSWKGGLQQDSSSSDAHCNVIIDHYVQRQNLPATLGKLLAFFARENQ